jgi:hypothetical protein
MTTLISLVLPLPPSVNDAFTSRRGSHLLMKSAAYWHWLRRVQDDYAQDYGTVAGPYGLWLELPAAMRGDLDNRVKLVSDVLRGPQPPNGKNPPSFSLGVVEDDRLMGALYVGRCSSLTTEECRATVVALPEWFDYMAMRFT